MVSESDPQTHPAEAALPSQGVRTTVSLLLFMHLFSLAVVIGSGATATQIPVPNIFSGLRNAKPLVAWGQFLFQDVTYKYALTTGDVSDVDHAFVVELVMPDGSEQQVVLPGEDLWPRQREQRLQTLARVAAGQASDDQFGSVLPGGVAQSLVTALGATRGNVRVQSHRVQSPTNVSAADEALRNPYSPSFYGTEYDARVLVDGSGRVNLMKQQIAGSEPDPLSGPFRNAPPPTLNE